MIQDIAKNINATYDENGYLTNDTISILYHLESNHIKAYC